MDHTRPRRARRQSDRRPDATGDAGGPGTVQPARGDVLDRLYAQWRDGLADSEGAILLQHTVIEDPDGAPYVTLLTGDTGDHEDLGRLWDETQRASDATILGRLARPLVLLEPVAGRWTVVRSTLGRVAREPLSHEAASSALQAARGRLGEVLRRGGIASDEAAILALIGADEEKPEREDPQPTVPSPATSSESTAEDDDAGGEVRS